MKANAYQQTALLFLIASFISDSFVIDVLLGIGCLLYCYKAFSEAKDEQ